MKLSFTYFFRCEMHISFVSSQIILPNIFLIKEDFDAPTLQKDNPLIMVNVVNKGVSFKIMFL